MYAVDWDQDWNIFVQKIGKIFLKARSMNKTCSGEILGLGFLGMVEFLEG